MKKKKLKKPGTPDEPLSMLNEPQEIYGLARALPVVKDYSYDDFKKMADKVPFTQAEWASMLHVSERTLQRYAKNNGEFAPINAERAQQIAHVIKRGKEVLGKEEDFYNWIKRNPYSIDGKLSLESLTRAHGIAEVLVQLGRIEQGIFA